MQSRTRDAIAKSAIEEAEAVTEMAKGQETVRVPGLTDDATIRKYFNERFVRYDYLVGDTRFVGVIVPSSLVPKRLKDQLNITS